MPRAVKSTLWIIFVISVMATAFYQIENWKGRLALKKILAEIKADGEPMTVDEMPGNRPPDDENFFKAPLVSSLVDYEVNYSKGILGNLKGEPAYTRPNERERLLAMKLSDIIKEYGYYLPETGSKGWESKEKADFEAWAEIFRADPEYTIPDESNVTDSALVLTAINSRFAKEWKELNRAASRPQSFYRPEWSGEAEEILARPMAGYSDWLQMSKFLNLQISAAIQERDFKAFRETVQIYVLFEKGIEDSSTWISNLVLSSSHSMLLGTLWFGLDSKSFSENDLRWIAGQLRGCDLAASALSAYRGERISFSQIRFEKMKSSATMAVNMFNGDVWCATEPAKYQLMIAAMVPDGWWDQNNAAVLRFNHHEFVRRWKAMDFSGAKGLDARIPSVSSPYSVISHASSFGAVHINVRFMQAYVMNQLAILACEIEIYALKNGGYPNALTDLVPSQLKSIPLDPFDGKSMKYLKVDDRYVVYSIGLNESDDHGTVAYRRPGRIDKKSGDWAWDYREVKKRDDSKRRTEFLEAIRTRDNPDEETKARLEEQKQMREDIKARLKESGLPIE